MRYLRKFVQRAGLVSTLLIGGVLGGLMAPLSSEAASLSIDGVNIPLTDTTGTGEGHKYTCETGFTSCWYITGSTTATRTIVGTNDTWTVANVSPSNRARVRINDVGGAPGTNVDKMNVTGMILTPTTAAAKTIHIIITHSYIQGQGVGDYQWGMGVTGHFAPVSPDTTVSNKFVLTGTGSFRTPSAGDPTGANDPPVQVGKLDKGAFKSPQAPGGKGIVTQTINPKTVKVACDTNGAGSCKPEITYDFEITVVGIDPFHLVDSIVGAGIICTEAQLDPLIPQFLLFLMRLVDPLPAVLPTHISGLNAWIDAMAVKYNLNPTQLAKLEKFKKALSTWLNSQTCVGKVAKLLKADSTSGVAAGVAAGGTLVTTCSDDNTCGTGTIVIVKKTNPPTIDNFPFTGTGSGIPNFGIRTDVDYCNDGCQGGSQTFSLLLTGVAGGSRTITETVFPAPPAGNNPWVLDYVNCVNEINESDTDWENVYDGYYNLIGVTVTNLADNDTLTCTFDNVSSEGGGYGEE